MNKQKEQTEIVSETHWEEADDSMAIAVVGMAGRFPGSPDLTTYWRNLAAGVESISFFDKDELVAKGLPEALVQHPDFVPARGALEHIESFDANFFGISPRQAALMDPQHRIFLECAWSALENAGYVPESFDGEIGTVAGCSTNTYLINNLLSDRHKMSQMIGLQDLVNTDKDHISTSTAYRLNLQGPTMTVQSACSTSLVAVHMGSQLLLSYQCDMVLAGAASVSVPVQGGHRYQPGHILSRDGHCRPFDADASGTVSGDGVGVVVLRRLSDALEDGDYIHAVIRGSATNNDGNQKIGYTAPSVQAQAEVIRQAHEVAEVSPESLTMIEAHGTGTALGDPIEIRALTEAFRAGTEQRDFCAVGSVKSNIGHLNTASGIAGLMKVILSLQNQTIPPSLHCNTPHPDIRFAETPFYVARRAQPWKESSHPRRAGVSSLGAGGTNVHMVVEEAPQREPSPHPEDHQPVALGFSAQTPEALQEMTKLLGDHLLTHPEQSLSDVAFTLEQGRTRFPYRRAIVANSRAEAGQQLVGGDASDWVSGSTPNDSSRSIVFGFPAQGSQCVGMGQALFEAQPVFRKAMTECFERFDPILGESLQALMFAPPEQSEDAQSKLDNQWYAGAALFSLSYALTEMWKSCDVYPDAVVGHSTGEYAAAAVAGILSLDDAIRLFMARARLFASLPDGGMLSVSMPAEDLKPLLGEDHYLSLHNGPLTCVVTGTVESIAELEASLQEKELPHKRLRVSVPAHSPLLEPIAAALTEEANTVTFHPPQIPFLSGVTGDWISDEDACDPMYWIRHMLQPVLFADALQTLADWKPTVLLEMGPARCLSPLAGLNVPNLPVIPSLVRSTEPTFALPEAAQKTLSLGLAHLWTLGARDFPGKQPAESGQRIPLPSYPFARTRHWIDPAPGTLPSLVNFGELKDAPPITHPPRGAGFSTTSHTASSPTTAQQTQAKVSRHPRPTMHVAYTPPETYSERVVVSLCEEILDIAPIGIHDEFLSLGADSLITVRLLQQLYERYGIELPQKALFRSLTVAMMASFIPEDQLPPETSEDEGHDPSALTNENAAPFTPIMSSDSTWSDMLRRNLSTLPDDLEEVVIPLRLSGNRPPLFLAHPAAGIVFPYFELAKQLGPDQPIIALQARGLYGESEPDRTCEEMADRYARALLHLQPQGPYSMAGFSFGAYICYEMARILQEHGQETAFLGLIDELVPIDGMRTQWSDLARLFVGESLKTFLGHLRDYMFLRNSPKSNGQSNGSRSSEPPSKRKWLEATFWKQWLQRSTMAAVLPQESHLLMLDQPALVAMFEMFRLHTIITFEYSPPPYEGDATLFRSPWTTKRWESRKLGDNDFGWKHLVKGNLDNRLCSGDHLGMVRHPHVQVLASEIRSAMDLALPKYPL